MSLYLILLAAVAVLLALCAALLYRNKALSESHKRELQQTITQAVQEVAEHRRRLDDDLVVIEEKHRVETTIERAHLADRTDFNNDWSGLRDQPTGYVAPNSSVTAASQAGATDHHSP
jgi:hypothetical protein